MSGNRRDWDVIVIGGGPAGIEAATRAAAYGLRTLLIEKSRLGGELLAAGSVQTHALLHAPSHRAGSAAADPAEALRYARDAALAARNAGNTEQRLDAAGVEVRVGTASFISPDAVEIGGDILTSEHFVLCTGSSPDRPDIPGLEEAGYRTNRDAFDIEEVPESVGVIGGGQVGVELAQAFSRLGARVTLFEAGDRILEHDDLELTSWLVERLRSEGIDIRLDARVEAVKPGAECHTVLTRGFGGPSEACCRQIVVATGRVPNVAGLNLAAAGVEYTRWGVTTNASLHTTGPRVWACGDLRGGPHFAHLAEADARLAVRNLFLPGTSSTGREPVTWCTFTDPELAHLGLNEEEALDMGVSVDVLREPFSTNPRAIATGATTGLVKLIAAAGSGRILGVHILGPSAGDLINEWGLAVRHGITLKAMADQPHVGPTYSQTAQQVARQWTALRAERPMARHALQTYNTLRDNREPIIYGLAAVGVTAGLLWAVRALARDSEQA